MAFEAIVVPRNDFNKWLEQESAASAGGALQ
jgi:heme/copper-type cytochrome/quinol oxidase subunit 2